MNTTYNADLKLQYCNSILVTLFPPVIKKPFLVPSGFQLYFQKNVNFQIPKLLIVLKIYEKTYLEQKVFNSYLPL